VINSHLLYQLSYRGMASMLLIEKAKSSFSLEKSWGSRGPDYTDYLALGLVAGFGGSYG
jgi:hypothetical protein